jgi:hypothetical protein
MICSTLRTPSLTDISSSKKKRRSTRLSNASPPKKPKAKAQGIFPLLSLPAEIREEIYRNCLAVPEGLSLVSGWRRQRRTIQPGFVDPSREANDWQEVQRLQEERKGRRPDSPLAPALLAVNKQVRDEAIGFLYGQPMIFQNSSGLYTFLANIKTKNRALVRDVTIREWSYGRGTFKAHVGAAFTLLADCTNLRRLSIDCDFSWGRTARQMASALYRDGHFFFEAFGDANGKKSAVVDILRFSKHTLEHVQYGTSAEDAEKELREALKKKLIKAGPRRYRRSAKQV